MNKKILGIGVLVLILMTGMSASATTAYFTALQSVYGTNGTSCSTCHIATAGGGPLTAYGTSFANISTHSTNPADALNSTGVPPGVPTATPTDSIPPVINSVELNTTTPNTSDAILITVNATDNVGVTGVMANSVALAVQGGNTFTWSGTITALEGTHSVNVSATDAANNVAWNNSTSYVAATPTAVTVSVSPQTQDVAPGATFTFTVNIDSGTTDVQFAHVELNYDTTNLTANSVTAGNLLDPNSLTEPGSGTGTPGKVKYGLARTSSAAAPVNGTFITLQFTANSSASGKPKLDLDNVKLMDANSTNISNTTINDGEVNISGTPVSTPTATPTATPTSTPGTGEAKVFGSPQTQVVAPGATFTFTVNIDSGSENLQFAHVELNYDMTNLTANTITAGNLLGAETLTEPGNGISPGKVKYGLARTSSAAAPVNGTFITVQFIAKGSASGIYVLDLANVVLMNSSTSQINNSQVIDGQVNVSGTPVLNWKYISVPYMLNNASVDYVLRGLVKGTDYTELYAWDSVGKQWMSPVTNFTPLNGYLIKIDTSKTMPVLERKTGAFIPSSLGVTKGWNLIGTSGADSMDAETMLQAIDDSYFSIWNWDVEEQKYDSVVAFNTNSRPAGSIGTDAFMMQPGISYWVWATKDTSLPALGP